MKKRIMLLLTCLFAVVGLATAQTAKVTGTVISAEDGEPIPGASVVIEGTSTGVVTNVDGEFVLTNLPASAKQLKISCAGMRPLVVRIKPTLHIALETDNKALEEVMVVAYGTQKRATFTGSAAVVGAGEIEKVQVTNAVDALKGKASGVQINTSSGQPGATPSIRIRGVNSLNADSSPLIVLDGSPFSGSLNDINPIDVESMTVLKDAAATALYGARGGNGVILVTTKSGKKGKDAVITVDAKWGSNSKATPEYKRINNPAAYYEMWYQGLKNYQIYNNGASESEAHAWANRNLIGDNTSIYGLVYNIYNVPAGEYMIGTNGKLNPNATLGNVIKGVGGQYYTLLPDDWVDETYHNSLRQEYTVSATAAHERGSFYASANYLDNQGITYASNYKRFTSRLKADYQVKKWLRVGGNMSYSHYDYDSLGEEGEASSGNAFAFTSLAPIYPMYIRDAQGHIITHQQTGLPTYDYGESTKNFGLTRPYLSMANPLSDNRINLGNTNGNSFNGSLTADVYLPKHITFYSINTFGLNEGRDVSTQNRYFGQYATLNGSNTVSHSRMWSANYVQRLNWHQQFGAHDIEVMAAHDYYQDRETSLYGSKNNSFFDNIGELSTAVIVGSTSSSASNYNTESWLGRAQYSYDDRYFGSVSFTHQASSIFHPKHRWGNFWAAGAGWLINREKFFKAKWVDELKLKASYGENGNDRIGGFLWTNLYGIVNSNDEISLTPSTVLANENITWEKNAKFNCGVDYSFFRGRLSGTLEFYNNVTRDMLNTVSLPMSMGYGSYYANVGNMVNRGFEFEVRGTVFEKKDFTWDIYANITSNSNKITKLDESRKTMEVDGIHGFQSGSYFYGEGISRFTRLSKKYAGVNEEGLSLFYMDKYEVDDDGSIKKDQNGNKIVKETVTTTNAQEATDYLVGDCLPDFYGGFGTSLSYKGFDFSVDCQYQIGGQIYDGSYADLMNLKRGHAIHEDMYQAWSPANKGSNIPRACFNDTYMSFTSDRFLTDASYLTLANVTLGYSLPAKLLKPLHITRLRLYAVADNIWTWSRRQGLDPRQGISGGENSMAYKPIRTVSGGITVTF